MPSLPESDRKAILELARHAVREAVLNDRILSPVPQTQTFLEPRALFVTLHAAKKLRGCIGSLDAHIPLGENLAKCAADAARHDPRFPRVRPDELDFIEIEVSLLSALSPVRVEDVQIGRHGLLVEQGARRGLLLPQVAVEHRLSKEQFLAETCAKAGLPREAWKEPATRIYAFECEIITEEKRASA